MPSQFFGLNIGASALSAFQTSVNTAANNVANVQTKGYTRQTANLAAIRSDPCIYQIRQCRNRCGSDFRDTGAKSLL